jgi:hypothetical protein
LSYTKVFTKKQLIHTKTDESTNCQKYKTIQFLFKNNKNNKKKQHYILSQNIYFKINFFVQIIIIIIIIDIVIAPKKKQKIYIYIYIYIPKSFKNTTNKQYKK